MKKTLYSKYDKTQINTLPRVAFEGRIVVVLTPTEAERAVEYLLSQPILGVDTETRPSFKRGVVHNVSLLQIASHDICFLFRLKHTGMSPSILPPFRADERRNPGYFIDLQKHVKEIGVEDLSLQKLYANFFGQKISKAQRLTNWDADILSDKQKQYAAIDAWSCINLYEELIRLEKTGDYELIKVQDEVQANIS